ncbi:MAG TPA: DUF4331 domain-containing protein [Thermoanaerobaculia bacterium]|jgi:hypothetical protein|nr:DUF4331 domain-containing protein [Thermoanaerobaculia bacterium]
MRRVPLLLLIALAAALPAGASSHREAPAIAGDPAIDATDLYAFVSPDRTDTVTLIANYIPLEAPYGGPNFFGFADWPAAQYEIHVDNNGDAVEDLTFLFQFRTETANAKTFLYNTGPITVDAKAKNPYAGLNAYQYYRVYLVKGPRRADQKNAELLGEYLPVAPNNVGPKSIKDYDSLANAAVRDVREGVKVFVGPRDDPFFVNLGRTFDLLNVDPVLPGGRDQDAGKAPDHLRNYNVHSIALQIPIPLLMGPSTAKTAGWPVPVEDPSATIGVWTTASRAKSTVLKTGGRDVAGEWVQVSRLGMPLVNEVVIPRSDKDLFNAGEPKDDARFLPFVQTSELAGILNALFKVKVPANPRNDLVQVFLKGVPKLTEKGVPCEYLRLNMAVPPSAKPNRLGLLAGQNDGFPNGRRLGDDVVDIALRVVAGVLDPKFNVSPNNELGDTVVKNDEPFLASFPYLAPPHDGVNVAY